MAIISLSTILQQKDDVLQSLRDRTKTYLSKWRYSQKAMANAVGISETYLCDFLNGRRGMAVESFAKIEQILSLNATQRKLQFYAGGSTGARFTNLQHKGQNIPGQIKLAKYEDGVVEQIHKEFQTINKQKLEV
jgi:transcriptional regulator with XRE-family HTH domain